MPQKAKLASNAALDATVEAVADAEDPKGARRPLRGGDEKVQRRGSSGKRREGDRRCIAERADPNQHRASAALKELKKSQDAKSGAIERGSPRPGSRRSSSSRSTALTGHLPRRRQRSRGSSSMLPRSAVRGENEKKVTSLQAEIQRVKGQNENDPRVAFRRNCTERKMWGAAGKGQDRPAAVDR